LFFLVNSYTTGLQPTSMKVILDKIYKDIPHDCEAYEIGIQTKEKEVVLPCGASAFMVFK
jgi:23S rRNA (cytosine1962-C5)-methyltransferase